MRPTNRLATGTDMADIETEPAKGISELEKKWTKPLVDAGWTAIPSVIFERQHALGLDPLGFAGGDTNLYGYVPQDPVNWSPPSGRSGSG